MQVLVSLAQRFVSFQGRLYAPTCGYSPFWERYLMEFDRVLIFGRVTEVDAIPNGFTEATGPDVDFFPLPDYHGPWQYWARRRHLQKAAARAVSMADAFILRVPCHVGGLVWHELQRRQLPYAVEVVADPWLTLAPGSVTSIARPVARRVATRELRRQCRDAIAASYVTQNALQRAYPPGVDACVTGCSDVILPDEAVLSDLSERNERMSSLADRLHGGEVPVRLGHVGTFDTMYKAPDLHIEAVAECRRRGLNVELMMVGEGRHRPAMQDLAQRFGVADAVTFTGQLPAGSAMLRFFDQIDLFLIASLAEGLPRALIEAMARGCPAIGSRVSGIPELLPDECLVEAGRAEDLANKIEQVLRDPSGCSSLAQQNRDRSRDYRQSVMNERRRVFYRSVARLTLELRHSLAGGTTRPSTAHTGFSPQQVDV